LLTAKELQSTPSFAWRTPWQIERGQARFPPKWSLWPSRDSPNSCIDRRKLCFDIWHLNSCLGAFIRKALCEIFRREGDFDICGEAENGRDAIEKAKQLRPDLIVLDLSMPVMNGLDAARVLKRLMPGVPLITYSAFGDGYVEQQAPCSEYPRSFQSLNPRPRWSAQPVAC
jgi:CheY-like chemotaxis protein